MDLFHQIEDATAIVRVGQIWKQTKVYQRGGVLFIPHAGGYVRVVSKFGDVYGTAVPKMSVVDIDGPGIVRDGLTVGWEG